MTRDTTAGSRRHSRLTHALPLLGLLCLARTGAAQDPRLVARLPAGLAERVTRLADSAGGLGLPTEPLIQKALEGRSKGADDGRIVAAVSALLGNLARAREALGPAVGDETTLAAAQALRLGATPTQLRDLRRWQGDRSLVVPLSVLSDLITGGVPIEQAWQSLQDVARHGGADRQYEQLRERLGPVPAERAAPPGARP